ncbi:MAG: DegT/DnrJ/EryC1/StrS family aminotransferase [Planctomycetes bacterium]|nr:DegT/DnrJ/EryC1/StrS family aminotransferase [Planctomycetota bacterium]
MTPPIPLIDVRAAQESLHHEISEAVERVLRSGRFVQGAEVARFEERFASYCEAKFAIAVDSGTAALHLALLACCLRAGDEVLTSPFTFVATGTAILHAAMRPAFSDILPDTLTLDPDRIEAALTSRTRAVVPVHLFGRIAEMERIRAIAERRGLFVIEDACQAHGARRGARTAGAWGHATVFSFYPSKNLSAIGDGGIVVTDDEKTAAEVRLRRDHGRTSKYEHGVLGWNYRMDEVQAAALSVKLDHLDRWNRQRQDLAGRYHERLSNLPLQLPPPSSDAVWHLYVVRTPRRDALRAHLDRRGIETGIHYPCPLHRMPVFSDLGYEEGRFPEAERAAREVLSLPLYPQLGAGGVDRIASEVRAFFA